MSPRTKLTILSLMLFLVACRQPVQQPAEPPSPTKALAQATPEAAIAQPPTPTLAAATATATQAPADTPAATPTGAPTITPMSTTTATPVPTATSSPTPSPTPEPTSDLPAAVMTATEPQTYDSLLSPDGTQRATLIIYPCVAIPEQEGEEAVFEYAYEQVNIINVNSGAERPMVDQLRYCGGVGAFGLELLFWSPSGRFLYYTTAREGSPDGCGYWWQPSFRRVNQSSGESEELGRGTLSPDRGKIAVWDRANRQLVVWETDGGEVGRTPAVASHLALGPISWSPKGDALVYLQGSGSCWPDTTYLMHVPLASMEPSLLLETSTPIITEVSWLDGQRLRLVDKEGGERVFELPPGSPD